ncbi:MAG: glycoside hydrolase family 172 protein [Sandaracinaceae bacterium]
MSCPTNHPPATARALRAWMLVLLVLGCDGPTTRDAGRAASRPDAGPPTARVTLAELVDEMSSLDHLARAPSPAYRTLMASSWDRRATDPSNPSDFDGWFANRDWGWFEGEIDVGGRRELVMLDAEGAGVITRIWSAAPMGTIRIYVDDMDRPAIEVSMESLLSETHPDFGAPFGYVVARGANLYFPIPFSRRVRITTDMGDVMPGLYYQVNYRLYEGAVDVEPWSPAAMVAARAQIDFARGALTDPDSLPIGDRRTVTLPATITAGPSGGVIRRLAIAAPTASAEALRAAVLSITFDGEETIRAPVGDFFGTAPGMNGLETFALATYPGRGELVARLPMPFATEATIAIEGALDVTGVEVIVDDWDFDATSRHLHAGWSTTGVVESQPKRDLDLVQLGGEGTFVGLHLMVVNPINEWWGEGDEKIYVDGDAAPTWFGTGTEDYFGYAYTDLALFGAPYHAQSSSGLTTQAGHVSNLRVHVIDAIPYSSGLDFDMELWAWVPSEIAFHWVTYWYANGGTDDYPRLEPGTAVVHDPATFRR